MPSQLHLNPSCLIYECSDQQSWMSEQISMPLHFFTLNVKFGTAAILARSKSKHREIAFHGRVTSKKGHFMYSLHQFNGVKHICAHVWANWCCWEFKNDFDGKCTDQKLLRLEKCHHWYEPILLHKCHGIILHFAATFIINLFWSPHPFPIFRTTWIQLHILQSRWVIIVLWKENLWVPVDIQKGIWKSQIPSESICMVWMP